MFTIIKKDTKKAQAVINSYNYYKGKTKGDNLYEIYNNYSYNKYNALKYCKNLVRDYNGFGACFGGHNCNVFSYYFMGEYNGVKYLFYITRDYNYIIEL